MVWIHEKYKYINVDLLIGAQDNASFATNFEKKFILKILRNICLKNRKTLMVKMKKWNW